MRTGGATTRCPSASRPAERKRGDSIASPRSTAGTCGRDSACVPPSGTASRSARARSSSRGRRRALRAKEGFAKHRCAAGLRCSPRERRPQSRPYRWGYERSLRPCLGTSIAPRRRAPFRQALLEPQDARRQGQEHRLARGDDQQEQPTRQEQVVRVPGDRSDGRGQRARPGRGRGLVRDVTSRGRRRWRRWRRRWGWRRGRGRSRRRRGRRRGRRRHDDRRRWRRRSDRRRRLRCRLRACRWRRGRGRRLGALGRCRHRARAFSGSGRSRHWRRSLRRRGRGGDAQDRERQHDRRRPPQLRS
jgi:hypothetical protein